MKQRKGFRALARHIQIHRLLYLRVITIFLVVVCFILFSVRLYNAAIEVCKKQLISEKVLLESSLYSTLQTQRIALDNLAKSELLRGFLEKNYTDNVTEYSTAYNKINAQVKEIEIGYLPNSEVRIFHNNTAIGTTGSLYYDTTAVLDSAWFDPDALYGMRSYYAFGTLPGDSKQSIICYCVVYYNTYPYQLKMVVTLALNIEMLNRTLMEHMHETEYFLTVPDGTICCSSSWESLGMKKDDAALPDTVKQLGNHLVWLSDTYPLSELGEAFEGWQLHLFSLKNTMLLSMRQSIIGFMVSELLILLVSLLLLTWIFRSITARSRFILNQMNRLVEEGKSLNSQEDKGLGSLDVIFDQTLQKTRELSQAMYERDLRIKDMQILRQQAELERKEAVLHSLCYQINPHYLYNTLEKIRMKLLLSGDRENSEIIQFFSESLRSYRKSSGDYVTVEEESSFLRQFMKLQDFRLGGLISFDCFYQSDIRELKLPHMLLQPVLENSVYHGFEECGRQGSIVVEFIAANGYLILRVEDDGQGMSSEQLQQLLTSLEESVHMEVTDTGHRESIGLLNVRRRIRLLYGDDGSMNIKSVLNQGTVVEIRLRIRA